MIIVFSDANHYIICICRDRRVPVNICWYSLPVSVHRERATPPSDYVLIYAPPVVHREWAYAAVRLRTYCCAARNIVILVEFLIVFSDANHYIYIVTVAYPSTSIANHRPYQYIENEPTPPFDNVFIYVPPVLLLWTSNNLHSHSDRRTRQNSKHFNSINKSAIIHLGKPWVEIITLSTFLFPVECFLYLSNHITWSK